MGIDLYNFNDGEANGPPKVTWKWMPDLIK